MKNSLRIFAAAATIAVFSGIQSGTLFTFPLVAKIGGEFSYAVDTIRTDEKSWTLKTFTLGGTNPCEARTGL